MTSQEFDLWTDRLLKRLDKKGLENKGLYRLKRRTLGTAFMIVKQIDKIPFDKLTLSLYICCKDTGFLEFARQY